MTNIINFEQEKFKRDSLRVAESLLKQREDERAIYLSALQSSLTDADRARVMDSISIKEVLSE